MSIYQSFNYDAFDASNMSIAEELKPFIGKRIQLCMDKDNFVVGRLTEITDTYEYDTTVLSLVDETLDRKHIIKAHLTHVMVVRKGVVDDNIYCECTADLHYFTSYEVLKG